MVEQIVTLRIVFPWWATPLLKTVSGFAWVAGILGLSISQERADRISLLVGEMVGRGMKAEIV